MNINTLENVEIEDIVNVLNLSFSDYIVPLQLNLEQLNFKISTENIKLNLSIGIFEADRLVGFMLHALNDLDGKLVAYNAATGVILNYRGQGLVAKMYDFLLPKLKVLNVKHMVLEVITVNASAIKAYEKMDYKAQRTLNCFGGPITKDLGGDIAVIKTMNDFEWDTFTSFWSIKPTWQNSIITLNKSKESCRILGAYLNNELVGYIVYNPASRKIMQIAVAAEHRRKRIGSQLVNGMLTAINSKEVLIFNVDAGSLEMDAFLKYLGVRATVSQFEMERII